MASFFVQVKSYAENGYHSIKVGESENCFKITTIAQLVEFVKKIEELKTALQNSKLSFNGVILDNDCKFLSDYNIVNNAKLEIEKYFDMYKHFGLKFVNKEDAITRDDDTSILRAELSCGHAVDPNSLTAWCRSLIDQGKFKFFCPAIVDGSARKCNAKWSYAEVRKTALLSEAEMDIFEKKLSENAAKSLTDYKECPNCRSFVERIDVNNLRVTCSICKLNGKNYNFCWQCEREWTVLIEKAKFTCGRDKCLNKGLEALANCKLIKLPGCQDLPIIPSIRACPTCGNIVEHNSLACKNVVCNICSVEFCFACLETTVQCQAAKKGSHHTTCAKPIAPIQKSIPDWNRNVF